MTGPRDDQRLAAYYADDLTGATDLMELLTTAGASTQVFLDPPSQDVLSRLRGMQCIGIAGDTRTRCPERIDEVLPSALRLLGNFGAPVVCYKVCSTFDSSAAVGSIGRALEVGSSVFGQNMLPVVGGSPHLGRYCLFGNLFARYGADGQVYRLDRHPAMRHHPATPMREADLTRVIGAQTSIPVHSVGSTEVPRSSMADRQIVVLDATTDDDLADIGAELWRRARRGDVGFVAGPAGAGRALALAWQHDGLVNPTELPPPDPVDRVLVLCGSASPGTAAQVEHARRAGYTCIELPVHAAARSAYRAAQRALDEVGQALQQGRSVIVLPDGRGSRGSNFGRTLTDRSLAHIADVVTQKHGLRRMVLCGGDTSGAVARMLGIESLRPLAAVAPAAPLCLATRGGAGDLEIAFKGGQMGPPDYFERVRGNFTTEGGQVAADSGQAHYCHE